MATIVRRQPSIAAGDATLEDRLHSVHARHPGARCREQRRSGDRRQQVAASSFRSAPSSVPALFVLGLVNFENFVFTTIAIRASLDITKTGAGNGGTSGVNSGTASAPGLDPTGALAILFILVAFFWMLTRMREGRKSPPMSIHRVCLILFALAGFLSVIDSASPSISLLEAIRVTAVVAMLAVLEVMLVDREMIQEADRFDLHLSDRPGRLHDVQRRHPSFPVHQRRREPVRGDVLAAEPVRDLPDAAHRHGCGAASAPRAEEARSPCRCCSSVSVVCLYFTFTRSAWIATVSGVFAVAFLGRRRMTLVVMVAAIMVSLVAFPTILQRFADLGTSTSAAGYASNSLSWRFDYWGEVLPLASKDPITGIGLNMSSFETEPAEGAAQRLPALLRRDGHHRDSRLPRAADQHGGGGPSRDAVHADGDRGATSDQSRWASQPASWPSWSSASFPT